MSDPSAPFQSFLEYHAKSQTYEARFSKLTARLLDAANGGLNILFDNKEFFCESGAMVDLAEIFRQQAIAIEELVENHGNEADAQSDFSKQMAEFMKRLGNE